MNTEYWNIELSIVIEAATRIMDGRKEIEYSKRSHGVSIRQSGSRNTK
jgi:hypothetical protein